MKKKISIRAPKGFRVRYKVREYDGQIFRVYCELFDLNKRSDYSIGDVELERVEGKVFATHSSLSSDYHNKGFGTLLYAKAIAWALNNDYKVRSSGESSDMAKRVWNGRGLRKNFNIRKFTDHTFSFTRETWYATRKRPSKRKSK